MKVLYWILALLLPQVFFFLFTLYIIRQWKIMSPHEISLCREFEFPDFGADRHESVKMLLSNKMLIWYTLFVITALLSLLSHVVGRIVFYISDAFMIFCILGQYFALFHAKNILRRIKKPIDLSFRPVVRMFRASLIYIIILFSIFNLFFDFVIFK